MSDNLKRRVSRTRLALLALVGSVSVALAACGGSSKPKATHTATTAAPSGPTSSVTTGPVHATLTADSHTPIVNQTFNYTVRVTDAAGHPLGGTVLTEFAYNGVVEGRETPPVHRLKNGVLHDNVEFPPESVGYPLELQTVVRTSKGSVTLVWPVTVKR